MSNVYIVNNTDGTLNITLKPGALNGPGGPNRDSDMRLYGSGALLWGEGVDENLLRLSETFACEEKSGQPGVPKDEADLGQTGLGITNPLVGQQWFNKTDNQLYVYAEIPGSPTTYGWKQQSGVYVATINNNNGVVGDLWYDTLVTSECGVPVLKIYDPTHPNAATNGWVTIGSDRVSVCGGNMSGTLSMSDDGGTTRNRITNLGDPVDPYDAIHLQYLTDELAAGAGDLANHIADMDAHLTDRQNELLDAIETCMPLPADAVQIGSDICALKGYAAATGTVYNDIDGRLERSGGTMTGFITLHSNPTQPMHAATRDYVDTAVGGGLSGGAVSYVRFFNSITSGTPSNGDVAIVSNIVYIYRNGWVQVFPAQYVP